MFLGQPCKFPFEFNDAVYHSCTTDHDPEGLEWCDTQNSWGHCSPGCREIVSSSDTSDGWIMMDNSGCFATDGDDQGTDSKTKKEINGATPSSMTLVIYLSPFNCSQDSPVYSHSPRTGDSTTAAPQTAILMDWSGAPPRPRTGTTIP